MTLRDTISFPTRYLKPGEIHLTDKPAIITTVLGSCISVTMYDKHTRLAAICHAVLPTENTTGKRNHKKHDIFQYVDSSLEWMLEQFEKKGMKRRDIEVKMFGGAEMFAQTRPGKISIAVGKKNIETALRIIEENHLKLAAWNIGGNRGRKVIFNTTTGEVFAKFVSKTDIPVLKIDNETNP